MVQIALGAYREGARREDQRADLAMVHKLLLLSYMHRTWVVPMCAMFPSVARLFGNIYQIGQEGSWDDMDHWYDFKIAGLPAVSVESLAKEVNDMNRDRVAFAIGRDSLESLRMLPRGAGSRVSYVRGCQKFYVEKARLLKMKELYLVSL